ncbi:MAG: hypothetical protein ACXW28_14055, partial [Thermoanaerobaculia bacterium]
MDLWKNGGKACTLAWVFFVMTERETGTDPVHWVIRPGDSVCSIAAASGHLPQTLWDDPANAD